MDDFPTATHAAATHEPDAVDARRIVLVALVLVATIAACIIASVWIAHGFARGYARPAAPLPTALPTTAGPPLQPDPAQVLARFRAQKEAMLQGYRWVDRTHGIAHIPIDEAMRIVARRNGDKAGAR